MASRHLAVLSSRRLNRCNINRSYSVKPKFYKEKPKYYKDVAQTCARFRREVSALRKEFREEWMEQQRMTQTEFSTKVAEEARQKKMEEERAFEDAAKELERMAKKREIEELKNEEMRKLKREKGEASRKQREEMISERLAQNIEAVEKATQNVMTSENLDEKIKEALSNEVLNDFIISPDTGKKKNIAFKNLK